jgi:hypothetical protein
VPVAHSINTRHEYGSAQHKIENQCHAALLQIRRDDQQQHLAEEKIEELALSLACENREICV